MSKALDDLLTKIPQWLGQFTRTLTHPSQVLSDQLGPAEPDLPAPAQPVQDGASFLILSFAVAAGVAIAFPVASMAPLASAPAEGALTQGAAVLRQLFVFLAAAAVVHGGSKLLGNRQAFAGFFGAVARFGGVTLVLTALAGALSNVGMADPIAARNWQELRQVAQQMGQGARTVLCQADAKTGQLPAGVTPVGLDPAQLAQAQALYLDTLSRPLMQVAAGLESLSQMALTLWLAWVWWRYLRVSGLSPARALGASAIGAVGLGAGYVLLTLIDGGQTAFELMQACSRH